ncbi:MAG TPA: SCO family protein [Ktedonobacterales bacterium]|nr:SCO family protein [Ktedonobacterales bacterium]
MGTEPQKGDLGMRRYWEMARPLARKPVVWAIAAVVVVALVVTASMGVYNSHATAAQSGPTSLQGTDLGATPEPAVALKDQNGVPVSLAQLRGKPVALTFYDSVCPHSDCSIMAQYMNATATDMGAEASQVNWVAISLNPWHDTQSTVQLFLTSHQVTAHMKIHYLMGTLPELAPIWDAFHMQSVLQTNGIVVHTTGVFVIDQTGRERIFLDEGFDPAMLASDLQLLLTNPHVATAHGGAGQANGAVSMTKTTADGTITLDATPGSYGSYDFTVHAWDAHNIPVQGVVSMTLHMTSMVMAPLHTTLDPLDSSLPGAYETQGVLSMAGQWNVTVQVAPNPPSSTAAALQPWQIPFTFTARY